jgi:hypothetical protein
MKSFVSWVYFKRSFLCHSFSLSQQSLTTELWRDLSTGFLARHFAFEFIFFLYVLHFDQQWTVLSFPLRLHECIFLNDSLDTYMKFRKEPDFNRKASLNTGDTTTQKTVNVS